MTHFANQPSPDRPPTRSLRRPADADAWFASRLALPVAWSALETAPSDRIREEADLANAGVLGFLLREIDLKATARTAEEPLETALAPIRARLDMLTDLVARFAYRDVILPPRCDIELGEHQITWRAARPLPAGKWVQIDIYFHPAFREPVALFGQIARAPEAVDDGAHRLEATLAPVPEDIHGGLARLALLTQRQQQSRPFAQTIKRAGW